MATWSRGMILGSADSFSNFPADCERTPAKMDERPEEERKAVLSRPEQAEEKKHEKKHEKHHRHHSKKHHHHKKRVFTPLSAPPPRPAHPGFAKPRTITPPQFLESRGGSSSSDDDDGDEDVPRSAISGRKIKMHRDQTKEDKAREAQLQKLRAWLNAGFD
ncbi:hypothetical protein PAPYR_10092 [Paratrimastix pyriformis]|uniref:Uncharacterized protein n=1 Tax=Paratrimastix pyriformis TaxID=342808 RepID=A0ABQ8U6P2_9EUKA|nr:hypothetical protein PAPYR_10092 [Paratrimastix pyriformis]